jgi:hypothetical protein
MRENRILAPLSPARGEGQGVRGNTPLPHAVRAGLDSQCLWSVRGGMQVFFDPSPPTPLPFEGRGETLADHIHEP